MANDPELLTEYVERGSQPAFAALVQRHLPLVYGCALRRVNFEHALAEDVTQQVFTDLARKATGLRDRSSLAGWLHVSTCKAAAAAVRAEQRRRTRETAATLMHTPAPADASEAQRLTPLLDQAMLELRAAEREAIAVRFFEQRSFAEVGDALGLSEEGARKRVSRALERLRNGLARHGITSSAAVLAATLVTLSSSTFPPSLATQVTTTAIAAAGIKGASVSTVGGMVRAMLPAAAMLVVGGFLIQSQRARNEALRRELVHLVVPSSTDSGRDERLPTAARQAAGPSPSLQPAMAATPVPSPPADPAAVTATTPITATVTVDGRGRVRWDDQPVTVEQFLIRAGMLPTTAGIRGSKIMIRPSEGGFGPLVYLLNEVRKSGISHVVVDGDVRPDPDVRFSWF